MGDGPLDNEQATEPAAEPALNLDAVRASLEDAASVLAEMTAAVEPEHSLSSR
jgi:hypothetical protein